MKKLKLNKEALTILNEKEMGQINGGLNFLSIWGSNCYQTDPSRHKCCSPVTNDACSWTDCNVCDSYPYGDAHLQPDGTVVFLDDNGVVIIDPEFDAETAPYYLV